MDKKNHYQLHGSAGSDLFSEQRFSSFKHRELDALCHILLKRRAGSLGFSLKVDQAGPLFLFESKGLVTLYKSNIAHISVGVKQVRRTTK